MINLFYSTTYRHNTTYDFHLKLCRELEKNENIKIYDPDNNTNANNLCENIFEQINKCDYFICDITPDISIDLKNNCIKLKAEPYISPNVMLELGYAMKHIKLDNILLILNTNITTERPSMLQGFRYEQYKDNDDETMIDIVDKINVRVDEFIKCNGKGWSSFEYKLSEKFLNIINNILDVCGINYIIRIHKITKKVVILFTCMGGYPRPLFIDTKILKLKNKDICLSSNKEIYDELKHIELISHLNWFN